MKSKTIKLVLTVEAEVSRGMIFDDDLFDRQAFVKGLTDQLVKIKSGPYENLFYGDIVKVEVK